MQTVLYLTRHGQTEWNVAQKMQGHKDSPLTELGVLHATWLGESIRPIHLDVMYASPSERTMKTAEIIRNQRNVPIIPDNDLREIHMGNWEGKERSAIELDSPDEYFAFWNTPDLYQPTNHGESFYDLQKRVLPKIQDIIAANEGKHIFIVTHAATLKVIMTYFTKQSLADLWEPPFLHSTALCKVVINEEERNVELYGDISHYKEE